ncbi:TlpA disulfide reductase family protein [Paenibacillus sp. LHD-117]|uniref:TlpA family protein disulfide reductase n=1 Tax=Paenibacillus sp. LHD-117 TaxID=3071412 RepID=UPI0027E061A1|nr:TlpA disulfide reductase family protein [Paenibacillus sp. LHD-117]MDQ6418836.1 TlpA disulfide reductase family protein [Paenibacillus sp. LHD-117]
MTNLQLGSLVLNTELLVYLAAGLMGLLAAKLRLRKRGDGDLSAAWNAILLWIAIWKGSLLLIDPAGVVRQPLSLFFFDGGAIGFWLASAAVACYLLVRFGKLYGSAEGWMLTGAFASGWAAIDLLAVVALDRESALYIHWLGLFVAVAAGLLLINIRSGGGRFFAIHVEDGKLRPSVGRLAAQSAGALLVLALLSYTAHDQTQRMMDRAAFEEGGSTAVGAREGNEAPAIELIGLSGQSIALDQFKGKTVLVNFWTTWCKVCMTEMPHVQKLYDEYREQGEDVAILSVNVTSQEQSAAKVRQYAEKQALGFPIALDERGEAAAQYRVAAYPSTFIIDSDGIIRERFLGAISYGDMRSRIERVRDR